MSDSFDLQEEVPRKQTGQLITAGVLAVLLIVLNVWPSDDEESASAGTYTAPGVLTPTPGTAEEKQQIDWPELDFADVIQTNPFRLDDTLAQALERGRNPEAHQSASDEAAAAAAIANQLAAGPKPDPSQYPLKFVFSGPRGRAAMIRDKVCYVGDVVDGMQVVAIYDDRVTLRPAQAETAVE